MKSIDFCSTTALLTLWPEASVWREMKVIKSIIARQTDSEMKQEET